MGKTYCAEKCARILREKKSNKETHMKLFHGIDVSRRVQILRLNGSVNSRYALPNAQNNILSVVAILPINFISEKNVLLAARRDKYIDEY